jgi:hypothetical protein
MVLLRDYGNRTAPAFKYNALTIETALQNGLKTVNPGVDLVLVIDESLFFSPFQGWRFHPDLKKTHISWTKNCHMVVLDSRSKNTILIETIALSFSHALSYYCQCYLLLLVLFGDQEKIVKRGAMISSDLLWYFPTNRRSPYFRVAIRKEFEVFERTW